MLQRDYSSGLIDRGDGFVLLGMTGQLPVWQLQLAEYELCNHQGPRAEGCRQGSAILGWAPP